MLSGGTTTELKSIADFRSRCEDRPRGLSRHGSRQHQASSGSLRLPIVLASLCSFSNQVSGQIDLLRYWKADKVARLVSTSCHVRWQRDVHTRQPHVNQLSVLSFKWGRIHFLLAPFPQIAVVFVEIFAHFSRDWVQQRFAEQIFDSYYFTN